MKRIFKITGICIAGITAFLAILILLLSLGVFNSLIAGKTSKILTKHLNGQVSIESLKGNILSHFHLKNMELLQENIPLISLKDLEVDYSLNKIFRKKLHVNYIGLNGIYMDLKEENDNIWNIGKLVDSPATPKDDTLKKPFSWEILIDEIQIDSLTTILSPLKNSSKIPRSISLNSSFSFSMANNIFNMNMLQFKLTAEKPSLQIENLSFLAEYNDSIITWSDLKLVLPHSTTHSDGKIPANDPLYADVNIYNEAFDFQDVNEWTPSLFGSAEIKLKLKNQADSTWLEFDLVKDKQKVKIAGKLSDLKDSQHFLLTLMSDSLNGEYWTHNPDLNSNLSGKASITGKGFDINKNHFSASAAFSDIKYENYELTDFQLDLDKNIDKLNARVFANTIFGNLQVKIDLINLFSQPDYELNMHLRNFDLAKVSMNKNLKSDLNLDVMASGKGFKAGELSSDLNIVSLNSELFNQPVRNFDARLNLDKEMFTIEGINIETPYLQAVIAGQGSLPGTKQLDFTISTQNITPVLQALNLKPLIIDAELKGELSGHADTILLQSDFKLSKLWVDSLSINDAGGKFRTQLSFDPLSGKTGSAGNENKSMLKSLRESSVNIDATATYMAYNSYSIDSSDLSVEKRADSFKALFTSASDWGSQETEIKVLNAFESPNYEFRSTFRNLNLASLTEKEYLQSDLNLEFKATGEGIMLDSMRSEIVLSSLHSTFLGLPIEDIHSSLQYNNGEYYLHNFRIETPYLYVWAAGTGNRHKGNNIVFDVETRDLKELTTIFGINNLEFNGDMTGRISGHPDSLSYEARLGIDHFKLDSIHIDQLLAGAALNFKGNEYNGLIDISLNHSDIQNLSVKKIDFTSNFNNETAKNIFSFYSSDSLKGSIHSNIIFSKNPEIWFPSIDLNIYDQHWSGGSESSYITLRSDSVSFNSIDFTSKESRIKAEGVFAFHGTEDLNIEIENVNLISLPGLKLLPYQISGTLNAMLDIKGSSENPVLNGILSISNPGIDTISFSKLYSSIHYANNNLSLKTYLDDTTSRILGLDVDIPVNMSFSEKFSLNDNYPVSAKLLIDQVDLDRLNHFIPLEGSEINGLLSANIDLSNTFNDPKVNGNIELLNGTFTYEKYGIDYKDLLLSGKIDNTRLLLDSLQIMAGKGSMKIKGVAELESVLKGKFKSMDFNAKAQNFTAFDSDMLKAFINADLSMKGPSENPVFSGNLTILKSTLNTDIFLKEFSKVSDDSDLPLLVKARKDNEAMQFSFRADPDTLRKAPPDVYKNLTGQFDIEIPRNTWVKGKNMNFELAGNLKAIKSGEQIDLFGTMNVKRGFYKIYGRRLEFEEGALTFTGGSALDPLVNFTISYRFRDIDSELKKIYVNITGKYSKPEVTFTLDGKEIEEKDAISYLLFNKNINQLDSRESATLGSNNLNFAKDLAIGQFTNIVKDALQSTLALDVIEISSSSSLSQGNLSVGKYINNNLFLNYERTFALDKKDKVIDPEKITLEYQFYRSLFLQATNQSSNSGFDFIFKKTWK